MSTNRIKWDDTANRLTAYCSDDSGETEIGPVKWDDTNNRLELNCDSTDYQAKWNDSTNVLEAHEVGAGCCGPVEGCPDCDYIEDNCDSSYTVTISGFVDEGTKECGSLNGTYVLDYAEYPCGTWGYYSYRNWGIYTESWNISLYCTGAEWLLAASYSYSEQIPGGNLTVFSPVGTIPAYEESCPTGTYSMTPPESLMDCYGQTGTAVVS